MIEDLESQKNTLKELILIVLKDNIVPFRELKLTKDNWLKEFGINQVVATPIGNVKIGNNQYEKLSSKSRDNYFGIVKLTLEKPLLVIKNSDKTIVFIKSFKKNDKDIIFNSIIIDKFDINISISSHPIKINNIVNRIINYNGVIIKSFVDSLKVVSTFQDEPTIASRENHLCPLSSSKTLNNNIISQNILKLQEILKNKEKIE